MPDLPRPFEHVVALTPSEEARTRAVAEWLAPALRGGGAALLAATPAHWSAVRARLRRMGIDARLPAFAGRIQVLDADDFLRSFMRGRLPERALFHGVAARALAQLRESSNGEIRAWGEMVDLLRVRGLPDGAMALERLWNGVLEEEPAALLCTYGLDRLSGPTVQALDQVMVGHRALLPESDQAALDEAVGLALQEMLAPASLARVLNRADGRADAPVPWALRALREASAADARRFPALLERVAERMRAPR